MRRSEFGGGGGFDVVQSEFHKNNLISVEEGGGSRCLLSS